MTSLGAWKASTVAASVCLLASSAYAGEGERHERRQRPYGGRLVVTAAFVDHDNRHLLIRGHNFGVLLPRVALGGYELSILEHSREEILVALADVIDSGSYLLQVSRRWGDKQTDSFEVTIGAAGPPGPPGEPGQPGPMGPPGPDHSEEIAVLRAVVGDLGAELAALQDTLRHFSRSGDEVIIEGANLHVRSGSGSTDGAVNGLGNVFVGYNEPRTSGANRTGSHNIVLGMQHNFSSYGGFVAGLSNEISGSFSSVTGGTDNVASGPFAVVGGGANRTVSDWGAWGSHSILDTTLKTEILPALNLELHASETTLSAGSILTVTGEALLRLRGGAVLIN